MRFAILGAGALGSIIGAHLARSGLGVTLVARGRRASQIMQDGIEVHGLERISIRVAVVDDPRELREADVLIVATKAIATASALSPLRDARVGAVLSVQNGVRKSELLAAAFGADRVLGAVANISGELRPDGEAWFTRNKGIVLGGLVASSAGLARDVARHLDAAGLPASVVADINDREWSKFSSWVSLMILAITTRQNTGEFLTDARAALQFTHILREIALLAKMCGARLVFDGTFPLETLCNGSDRAAIEALHRIGEEFRLRAPEHRVSALHDLQAGRPLEIEETLGYARYRSKEMGLDLPWLNCSYDLLSAMNRAQALANHSEGTTP